MTLDKTEKRGAGVREPVFLHVVTLATVARVHDLVSSLPASQQIFPWGSAGHICDIPAFLDT